MAIPTEQGDNNQVLGLGKPEGLRWRTRGFVLVNLTDAFDRRAEPTRWLASLRELVCYRAKLVSLRTNCTLQVYWLYAIRRGAVPDR